MILNKFVVSDYFMYTISLEQFSGPLDLLLNLIEKQELDISRVSVAKVTDEFLNYLKRVEDKKPSEIADFLYLAAKLVYIKSTILLPYLSPEEEEEISGFERGLRLYKEFQEAAKNIKVVLAKKNILFSREKFFLSGNFFTPPKNINKEKLYQAFKLIAEDLEKELMMVKKMRKRSISLTEKIEEIKNILNKVKKLNFDSFLKKKNSKPEAIASFLAILELFKKRIIELEQDRAFSEIKISSIK